MAKESLELVGKFIASDEIVTISQSEQKTPQGGDMIEVEFKNGRTCSYPVKTIPYLVTDKSTDYNSLQDRKFEPIIRELVDVLFEYDVKLGEFQALLQAVGKRVDDHLNRAMHYMWTKNDETFTAGFDPMYDVSFLMADKVVRSIPKKEKEKKDE